MSVNINVVFSSGIGHLNAKLYRTGVALVSGSVSVSGTIHFVDAQSGDVISIDGVCNGSAKLTIDVPTNPGTPKTYLTTNFFDGFIIS
jgi:hypothetical protein